ncbi:cysteine synthase A [Peptacetobacter hominis]|uniref:Cysteine synthase n=1 Tax=Peptacetobacter hominis TaxID=2743610 RepID=A0A544QT04_9FIRM|nr:cysteine synthase A [Peptacetobacter hominis]TQQ83168.1 cysteine synthase A [Peptacetobacter hominis]
MIYNKITETIGNTPVLRFREFETEGSAEIYGKLEFFNPGGSIKDRIASFIMEEMKKEGKIKPGDTIVEPTSGNTGIGIAMSAAANGFKAVMVMPDTMSVERQKILKAYGAEIVLTPGKLGMNGAVEEAERLVRDKGYIMFDQFNNTKNPKAHENSTALEIINDFESLDAFVAGVGTGGTIMGNGPALKKHYSDIEIVAVEPDVSAILSGEKPGPHKIQGIGANFIPSIVDTDTFDKIEKISSEDAYKNAVLSAATTGVMLGISGGAALSAAIKTAKRLGKGKKVLFIAPDNGERYLSTDLYSV